MNFNFITKTAGHGLLILKKFSPEILMGTGVIGVVASTVLCCRSTLKVDTVLDEVKDKLDILHENKELFSTEEYTESLYKRDMAVVYIQTGWEFVKLYGPAVTLGVASIGCILSSHGIMRKRNLALVAAYKAVEESFSKYRERVIDEYGEKVDRHFKYGTTEVEHTEAAYTDENGVKHEAKTETIENVVYPNNISQYAKVFDESSTQWSDIPEYNKSFLIAQQNYANDQLHSTKTSCRKHLFLNEVYDMLGLPRTQAGAQVGWVEGMGDDYVDFNIFNINVPEYASEYDNETIGEKRSEFINGYRPSILLDFNVAGVIYDLI